MTIRPSEASPVPPESRCVKTAFVGPLNTPHEYVYIPDAARILFRLIQIEKAYRRTWHLAGAGRITLSELSKLVESIIGRQLRKMVVGKRSLQVLGLFEPVELAELLWAGWHGLASLRLPCSKALTSDELRLAQVLTAAVTDKIRPKSVKRHLRNRSV